MLRRLVSLLSAVAISAAAVVVTTAAPASAAGSAPTSLVFDLHGAWNVDAEHWDLLEGYVDNPGNPGIVPTGTVTARIDGAATTQTQPVNGQVFFNIDWLPGEVHTVAFTYSGDSYFAGSTLTKTFTLAKLTPPGALGFFGCPPPPPGTTRPPCSFPKVRVGEPVHIANDASWLYPIPGLAPTGEFTFVDEVTGDVLGTAPVNNWAYNTTVAFKRVGYGSSCILAKWPGDAHYAPRQNEISGCYGISPAATSPAPTPSGSTGNGYRLLGADGGVFTFGGASFMGSAANSADKTAVVGSANKRDGSGYWIVHASGRVEAFGSATHLGDVATAAHNGTIISIAATPSGSGYWLVGSDGGIYTFGDAEFFGSTGGKALNAPIISMTATPSGSGYWLLARDGGIFTFGDAAFFGSTGDKKLNAPIITMAATPKGDGYWLVGADGGIFTFGNAGFFGSTGDKKLNAPVIAMASTASGSGYWLVGADGGIFTFGDAAFFGSTGDMKLNKPIIGISGA